MPCESSHSALCGEFGLSKKLAISIRSRLLNLAKSKRENFDYVLRQYLMQRLLYRLSISQHSNQFLLKGAMLFWVWNQESHRPTRDIDLLGFGNNDKQHLSGVFADIFGLSEDDGLVFQSEAIRVVDIKEDAKYQGVRVTGYANLDTTRIPFQIDIGFGDAVTPEAEIVEVESFLDLPNASIAAYPVYTVIAEKFQAMVELGIANSRLKDFYDVWVIANQFDLDGGILSQAIAATFARRETVINLESLSLFSDDFKNDKQKSKQWSAFLNKNNLNQEREFSEVLVELEALLLPIYRGLAEGADFAKHWSFDPNPIGPSEFLGLWKDRDISQADLREKAWK